MRIVCIKPGGLVPLVEGPFLSWDLWLHEVRLNPQQAQRKLISYSIPHTFTSYSIPHTPTHSLLAFLQFQFIPKCLWTEKKNSMNISTNYFPGIIPP